MIAVLAAIASSAVTLPQLLTPLPKLPPPLPSFILSRYVRQYSVSFFLSVSPAGTVFHCEAESPIYGPAVSNDVCKKFRSARLSAATGRDGTPQYGKLNLELTWPASNPEGAAPRISDVDLTVEHLPSGSPLHPHTQLALTIGPDGKMTNCDVVKTSGIPALDAVACKAETSAMAVGAERDEAGKPVVSVQPLTVGFGAYAKIVAKKDVRYDGLGDAGPYFPYQAAGLSTVGHADLTCEADALGRLKDCQLDEEDPLGFQFGVAALRAVRAHWIQVSPGEQGPVLLRVNFPKVPLFLRTR